ENFGDAAFCFDVSGLEAEPTALESCINVSAGLSMDDGGSLRSEFALPLLVRAADQVLFETVTATLPLKAYNARHLLNTPPLGLNQLRSLQVEQINSSNENQAETGMNPAPEDP
ncbi:MAG: hypothetical protein MK135_02690, partial [Polyangiaceae bacterium]|nr:hypothetical protein [Polyangiaceae bacterium]